jgi:nucleotide-binding universal stress UspA family protein
MAEAQLRRVVETSAADLALAARSAAKGSPLRTRDIQTEVVHGADAAKALATSEWLPGDLLVSASSEAGPLRKVFLGDMSLKILRAVPCPVIVLPKMIR